MSIHGLIILFRPTPFTERIGAELGLAFSHARIVEHLVKFSLAAVGEAETGTSGTSGTPGTSGNGMRSRRGSLRT